MLGKAQLPCTIQQLAVGVQCTVRPCIIGCPCITKIDSQKLPRYNANLAMAVFPLNLKTEFLFRPPNRDYRILKILDLYFQRF